MPGVAGRSGGRNAKTDQEHLQRGTYRNDRHGNYTNPNPPKDQPIPPKPLHGEAKAEWDRMIDRLTQANCLSLVDDAALYQCCQLFADIEDLAAQKVATDSRLQSMSEGVNDIEPSDRAQAYQAIVKMQAMSARYDSQIRQGRMAMRVFLVEFGLTPAARSRVKLPKTEEPGNKWDGLVQ